MNPNIIHYVIKKYFRHIPPEFYDDIYQYGALGLMEAEKRYDPNKTLASLEYFAFPRIRYRILDSIRHDAKQGFLGVERDKELPFKVVSWQRKAKATWDGGFTFEDVIGEDGLEDRYAIRQLVENLPPKLGDVVRWYYWDEYTMLEIAGKIDRTESRVSQMLKQAKQIIKREIQ